MHCDVGLACRMQGYLHFNLLDAGAIGVEVRLPVLRR